MLRIINISLLTLLLSFQTGLVNLHYCDNVLSSVHIFGKESKSCCDNPAKRNTCCVDLRASSIFDNSLAKEISFKKLKKDDASNSIIFISFINAGLDNLQASSKLSRAVNTKIRPEKNPIYLRNCVFII